MVVFALRCVCAAKPLRACRQCGRAVSLSDSRGRTVAQSRVPDCHHPLCEAAHALTTRTILAPSFQSDLRCVCACLLCCARVCVFVCFDCVRVFRVELSAAAISRAPAFYLESRGISPSRVSSRCVALFPRSSHSNTVPHIPPTKQRV